MARQRYKSGKKKGKFMSNRAIASAKAARKGKRKKSKSPKRRRATVAKRRKKGRRRRSGSSGISSNKVKMEVFAAGAAWGYLEKKSAAEAEGGWMASLPSIESLGADGTKAVLLYFLAKNTSGKIRKWADRSCMAYVGATSLAFGRNDFKLTGDDGGRASMYDSVAGEIEYDPDLDDDDDDDDE